MLINSLVAIAGGSIFLFVAGAMLFYEITRLSGLSGRTSGVIAAYDLDDDDGTIHLKMRYRYEIAGKAFEGKELVSTHTSKQVEAALQKQQLAQPIRSAIEIHYHPQRPQKSVPAFSAKINIVLLIFALILAGIGLGIMLTFL
jgi:hypothetical protein